MDPDRSPDAATDNGVLSTLSNEMVKLYKDQFGRGPTKTRSMWAGPDTLVVLLEQTFTPAERRLAQMGEHARLRDLRMLFQYAELPRFCAPVERLTGRKVRAFVSGLDTEADLATEMFILHPAGYGGASRAQAQADEQQSAAQE